MYKQYKTPNNVDFEDFADFIRELKISGYTGIGGNRDQITIFFEEGKKLTSAELKKLDNAVKNYKHKPSFNSIRAQRVPLLSEADWRFNKAIDENNLELLEAIKKYRIELRDITLQDRSQLVWPEKPWE